LPQSNNDIVVTAQKYGKKALDCAASYYGLGFLTGAGAAAAGANVVTTGGKFAGATPGTSLASIYAGKIFGNAKLPLRLPTLTGFPGIGNGWRVSATESAARFAGRAVPVLGYALMAYDAYEIGSCTVQGD
jgi:hypothetical protein